MHAAMRRSTDSLRGWRVPRRRQIHRRRIGSDLKRGAASSGFFAGGTDIRDSRHHRACRNYTSCQPFFCSTLARKRAEETGLPEHAASLNFRVDVQAMNFAASRGSYAMRRFPLFPPLPRERRGGKRRRHRDSRRLTTTSSRTRDGPAAFAAHVRGAALVITARRAGNPPPPAASPACRRPAPSRP